MELLTDLGAHDETVQALQERSRLLVEDNNLGAAEADQRVREAARAMGSMQEQGEQRRVRLAEALQRHTFDASLEEIEDWLELCEERLRKAAGSTSPEECAVLQKQCNALVQDLAKGTQRHEGLTAKSAALTEAGHSAAMAIAEAAARAKERWSGLRRGADERCVQLKHEYELLRFHRDADETMDWIAEKECELEKKKLGESQADVEVLQRKHAALERDIEALGTKLEAVFAEAGRLVALHPAQAKPITQKQNSMAGRWEAMQDNASARKRLLQDALEFFKFQAAGLETLAWIQRSADLILNVEPPSDVADAEARLDEHLEVKVQLDAQQPSMDSLLSEGEQLKRQRHPRQSEIAALLGDIRERHADLLLLWEEHLELRHEAVFVQEFHRDASECEAWLAAHEAYVRSTDVGEGNDSIHLLLKKFDDFEQSMAARAERVSRVDEVATALTDELQNDKLNPVYRKFNGGRSSRSSSGAVGADRRQSLALDKARRRRASLDTSMAMKGGGRTGPGRTHVGGGAGRTTPPASTEKPRASLARGATPPSAATLLTGRMGFEDAPAPSVVLTSLTATGLPRLPLHREAPPADMSALTAAIATTPGPDLKDVTATVVPLIRADSAGSETLPGDHVMASAIVNGRSSPPLSENEEDECPPPPPPLSHMPDEAGIEEDEEDSETDML
jgi:hypothetical protein